MAHDALIARSRGDRPNFGPVDRRLARAFIISPRSPHRHKVGTESRKGESRHDLLARKEIGYPRACSLDGPCSISLAETRPRSSVRSLQLCSDVQTCPTG